MFPRPVAQLGKNINFDKTFEPGKHQIKHEINGGYFRMVKINQTGNKIIFCNITILRMKSFSTNTSTVKEELTSSVYIK